MKKDSQKLVVGCGIGCAAIVLILIVLGILGYNFVQDTIKLSESFENSVDSVFVDYGYPEDYTPPSNFNIESEVEKFIAVQKDIRPYKDSLNSILLEFETIFEKDSEEDLSFWESISFAKRGVELLPILQNFIDARNQSIKAQGSTLGEYYFVYITIYHSWLNKSPGDGPFFELSDENSGGFHVNISEEEDMNNQLYAEETYKRRFTRRSELINKIYYKWLKNLETSKDFETLSKDEKNLITNEIDYLQRKFTNLPWENGLPEEFLSTFEKT